MQRGGVAHTQGTAHVVGGQRPVAAGERLVEQ